MAVGQAYNKFEDVGMAFTEEEIANWDGRRWAADRVETLIQLARVLKERSELLPDHSGFFAKASGTLLNRATWYCHAMELEGFNRDEALEVPDEVVKSVRASALKVDVENFVNRYSSDTDAKLRYVVTIGRRAAGVGGVDKAGKKLGNKLANSVLNEVLAAEHLQKYLLAHPVSGGSDLGDSGDSA